MGNSERSHDDGSTETCPKRSGGRGPDGHAIETVEQPTDLKAFYVQRCVACGWIALQFDTEREYLNWVEN